MGRRIAGVVAVGLVAAVTACASGVPAVEWADRVCSALTPWRGQIADLNTRAQNQMSTATNPTETRENLLVLLGGGRDASDNARTALVAAGEPRVEHGREIADRFVASITKARDSYSRAHDSLQRLPVDDPTVFYDGVIGVLGTLQSEYATSEIDTSQLESLELRDAFERADKCQ